MKDCRALLGLDGSETVPTQPKKTTQAKNHTQAKKPQKQKILQKQSLHKGCRRSQVSSQKDAREPGAETLVADAVHECAELARAGGMAQLAQSFGFDLADAFARDGKGLP